MGPLGAAKWATGANCGPAPLEVTDPSTESSEMMVVTCQQTVG